MSRKGGPQPSHKGIDSVSFGVLSSDEIKQSSVLKVWAPLSFNQYGRPTPGGPYDYAMGPTDDRGSLCTTCVRSAYFCPGHMGHIELPVPVVNPMFRRQLSNILGICCVNCYKTQIPDFAKYMLLARLQLLDMGYSTAAVDAEQAVMNPDSNLKDNEAIALWAQEKLDEYVESVMEKGGGEVGPPTKTYEALKRLFIDFTMHSVGRNSKTCIHCKTSLKRFNLYRCRFITNLSKVKVAKKFSSTEPQTEEPVHGKGVTVTVRADELRDHMRNIWVNERDIAEVLFPMLQRDDMEFPTDLFFLDTIPVSPPKARPPNFVAGSIKEHPQTYALKQVLQDVLIISNIAKAIRTSEDELKPDEKEVMKALQGATLQEKLSNSWDILQSNVDHLLDKDLNKNTNSPLCFGAKQIMEKKEGLFRMHMMGKRVNFAARSVITPDPNLNVDEIGIPEVFAKKLTYPTPVTPWNVEELRKLVLNGPSIHPGAVMIQNEDGSSNLIKSDDPQQREALAKRLLTPPGRARFYTGPKIVHRHLCNGDMLLLNRQPTLHRPSIMSHKARVLKGEKTIRLHYANCSSYNADFDGDEMNAHFPQNELARSEAFNLVNVCYQYLVPKSGTPLSGLIQDHVISGVRLTMRGRFFNREDYQQLVYQGLSNIPGKLRLLPPCILKPQCLWSGKQVLSTVLLNVIPRDKAPISLEDTAKISAKAWENMTPREWIAGGTPLASPDDMTEAEVVIRDGELVCGVLDKKHYGATPYGLVHCVYELYGGMYSARLLSAFAKLFTAFLQTEGFTLGVADIIVLKKADRKRSSFIKQARKLGDDVVREALELPPDTSVEELRVQMKSMFSKDPIKYQTTLDRQYKSALDAVTNEINKTCLPAGLVHKFPSNNLQLMVQSGAKGSTVNTMQISCLLGQIELEGKRPPLMISGKSLPSFIAFDTSPRAGGFIEGRFMTGIRPQEFFFHCMAGREGLIDTAVKTSRSGYLQRCLVKHLEGLVVGYDQTVRDSDGSVIQYYYGEDGMDVCKAQFLTQKQLPVLCNNSSILDTGKDIPKVLQSSDQEELAAAKKELKKWKKKHSNDKTRRGGFLLFCQDVAENMADIEVEFNKKTGHTNVAEATVKAWRELDDKSRKRYEKSGKRCPDPISSKFRLDQAFGSLSEKLESLIEEHVSQGEREEELRELLQYKSMLSQASPGEPVGVLAAQSVGEPSTQMTLNTFHFAGRGDMNVTLGIPRLRELFMMATKELSTPAMDIPFLPSITESKAERLRIRLTKVTLADVLEKISVTERVDIGSSRQYTYKIRFSFLPRSNYKHKYPVKPKNILKFMEHQYFFILEVAMKKALHLKTSLISTTEDKKSSHRKGNDDEGEEEDIENPTAKPIHIGGEEGNESSDEEAQAEDEDATMARTRSRHTENREYEDPEEEEIEQESDMENDEGVDDGTPTEANYSGGTPEKDEVPLDKNELLDDPIYSDFPARIKHVKTSNRFIQNYEYDFENELWCEIVLGISLDSKKVDMSSILRSTAKKAVIWHVPNINKAFIYKNSNQELMLKVDGINISEILKHHKFLDLNRLYTNSIHYFAATYGIEAACRVLVKEVQDVFQVYGITVDPRHLLLIADYMTFEGIYLPLNRFGIANNASPFQKMTFETSLAFLRSAVLEGKKDYIQSPSSCIVTGRPCRVGTGTFDLRLQINV